MVNVMEREEIVYIESPTRTIRVTGWRHDDGDAVAQVQFGEVRHTVSPTEAHALVRGLQRWLSELRNRAATE